jgi:hypothetical protein
VLRRSAERVNVMPAEYRAECMVPPNGRSTEEPTIRNDCCEFRKYRIIK